MIPTHIRLYLFAFRSVHDAVQNAQTVLLGLRRRAQRLELIQQERDQLLVNELLGDRDVTTEATRETHKAVTNALLRLSIINTRAMAAHIPGDEVKTQQLEG